MLVVQRTVHASPCQQKHQCEKVCSMNDTKNAKNAKNTRYTIHELRKSEEKEKERSMTMTMSRQLKSAFIALVFLTVQSSLSIGFALPQNNEEYLSFIENKTTTVPRKALMHNSNLTQYAATNAYGDETKTKLKRSLLGAAPLCRNPWCFYINTRQRLRVRFLFCPICVCVFIQVK